MIAQIKIVPTACFATKIDKSKITKEMLAKVSKRSPRCGAFLFFTVALFDTPPVLE